MNEPATLSRIAPSEGTRRARSGGTSRPSGTSVWDAHPVHEPVVGDGAGAVVEEREPPRRSHRQLDSATKADRRSGRADRRSARRAEPSRWSVDPRFLAAVVVVGAPAFAIWHLARSDAVRPTSAPPAVTAPHVDQTAATSTGDADEVAIPDFVDGAVVGSWNDDAPLGEPADARDTWRVTTDSEPLTDVSATAANGVDGPTSGAPVYAGSPEPIAAPVGSPMSVAVAPTSDPVETATTTDQDAAAQPAVETPRVEIVTRVVSCRFSSRCLVAGFAISGFDVRPAEYLCEFASGERYAFPLTAESVDFACATGEADDSITIEVGGVRSETVAHV